MSHEPNDGGSAFPYPAQGGRMAGGMSLRDYFAGQALTGLMSRGPFYARDTADEAYKFADAMLAARDSDTTTAQQIALGIGGGK